MADNIGKVPVKNEKTTPSPLAPWRPFESLRREIDRLFEDFDGGWRSPFPRSLFGLNAIRHGDFETMPAVDVTETDKAYEIAAELPGIDEKDVEVKLANGVLTIKGEKHDEKEEKKKDYYMRERNFGTFQRMFQVPDGVDLDKIDASFRKGVLTVTLPKSADAQKSEKKIAVKTS